MPLYRATLTRGGTQSTTRLFIHCLCNLATRMASSPLKGIKVIEFSGLAPAPLCGMILSDFGADVIRVDKKQPTLDVDCLSRGKRSIAIDLKKPRSNHVVKKLCKNADVLLEPFRAGVMEKLGLGPDVLTKENRRLVYARLTGFGQSGPFSSMAGHDINYLAISGILSMIGREKENPLPPLNLLGDFGGGSLICALGITLALLERNSSGLGQVIDANIVEGTAYLCSWLWRSRSLGFLWNESRGRNVLDSGRHFYETYRTKDDKFVAVGAIEPQFYDKLLSGLKVDTSQFDEQTGRQKLTEIFAQKTRAEWCEIFDGSDACVTPVLSLDEAVEHPHNKSRGSFVPGTYGPEPVPAPILERTPGKAGSTIPIIGQHTKEILIQAGFTEDEVAELSNEGIVQENRCGKKLANLKSEF